MDAFSLVIINLENIPIEEASFKEVKDCPIV